MFGLDIPPESICLLDGQMTMYEALERLTSAVCRTAGLSDSSGWLKAIAEREAVMTTGIGGGVAIPHVCTADLDEPTVGLGLCAQGISYETLDKHPVQIIVLFAMPKHAQRKYLGLLAQTMQAVRQREFREQLLACGTRAEVLGVLQGRPDANRRAQAG